MSRKEQERLQLRRKRSKIISSTTSPVSIPQITQNERPPIPDTWGSETAMPTKPSFENPDKYNIITKRAKNDTQPEDIPAEDTQPKLTPTEEYTRAMECIIESGSLSPRSTEILRNVVARYKPSQEGKSEVAKSKSTGRHDAEATASMELPATSESLSLRGDTKFARSQEVKDNFRRTSKSTRASGSFDVTSTFPKSYAGTSKEGKLGNEDTELGASLSSSQSIPNFENEIRIKGQSGKVGLGVTSARSSMLDDQRNGGSDSVTEIPFVLRIRESFIDEAGNSNMDTEEMQITIEVDFQDQLRNTCNLESFEMENPFSDFSLRPG